MVHEARNEKTPEAAFLKSAQLDPNLIHPHVTANFYVARQKFDLAVTQGEEARNLDPRTLPRSSPWESRTKRKGVEKLGRPTNRR